ncbi:MAG TPA: murein biosynthesis integral membrane protein MurJ [Thermomicrobiales bacterium]|nr:murein biosynthesis integral membrane protein MurJ [Thermomicrobiales bacterium]
MVAPDSPPAGASHGRIQRSIALSAAILMLGSVLSRVLGLVREQLAAGYFGAGDEIAAFTIADNLQTLLFDLMVSGALQAALIPVLAQLVLPDHMEQAELRRVGGALVTWVIAGTGVLALLGMLLAPQVVAGLVWFSGDEVARGDEARELTIRLVRIVMPASALLGLGTVLQAMLHAIGAVTAPALATAVRNFSIIVAMVVLADALGVESMAWGTLAGAALIVFVQLVPLARHHALPVPNLDLGHPAIRRMGVLYLPVFAGLLVSSLAVIVDRGLAWGAGELAVGAMRYATTLVQLVLGLIAAAMSLASLPMLSRHFSAGDERSFAATLSRVLGMVTVLILPATVGLAVLARPITTLLFGHGATGPDGVDAITIALLGYLPGTLAAAYDQVLIFAFYARHNTRTPVIVGVLAVLVYFAAAFSLVGPLGMLGLVLANSFQFIAHALVMWWAIRSIGVQPFGPDFIRSLRGSVVATVTMAVAVAVAFLGLTRVVGLGTGIDASIVAQLAQVTIPALIGVAVYGLVLRRAGVRELADLQVAIGRRLGRIVVR